MSNDAIINRREELRQRLGEDFIMKLRGRIDSRIKVVSLGFERRRAYLCEAHDRNRRMRVTI